MSYNRSQSLKCASYSSNEMLRSLFVLLVFQFVFFLNLSYALYTNTYRPFGVLQPQLLGGEEVFYLSSVSIKGEKDHPCKESWHNHVRVFSIASLIQLRFSPSFVSSLFFFSHSRRKEPRKVKRGHLLLFFLSLFFSLCLFSSLPLVPKNEERKWDKVCTPWRILQNIYINIQDQIRFNYTYMS